MKIPKRLKSYNYWLQMSMMVLAVLLTVNLSVWLTCMFIVFIFGFIDGNDELPLKEHDRVRIVGLSCIHSDDYYFVKYIDDYQREAVVTLFPGGDSAFEIIVNVNDIHKE